MSKINVRKISKRKVVIGILLSIVLLLSVYFYRLSQADLLTTSGTSGGWITPGIDFYFVINSETGSRIFVPRVLLPVLGYNEKK